MEVAFLSFEGESQKRFSFERWKISRDISYFADCEMTPAGIKKQHLLRLEQGVVHGYMGRSKGIKTHYKYKHIKRNHLKYSCNVK